MFWRPSFHRNLSIKSSGAFIFKKWIDLYILWGSFHFMIKLVFQKRLTRGMKIAFLSLNTNTNLWQFHAKWSCPMPSAGFHTYGHVTFAPWGIKGGCQMRCHHSPWRSSSQEHLKDQLRIQTSNLQINHNLLQHMCLKGPCHPHHQLTHLTYQS